MHRSISPATLTAHHQWQRQLFSPIRNRLLPPMAPTPTSTTATPTTSTPAPTPSATSTLAPAPSSPFAMLRGAPTAAAAAAKAAFPPALVEPLCAFMWTPVCISVTEIAAVTMRGPIAVARVVAGPSNGPGSLVPSPLAMLGPMVWLESSVAVVPSIGLATVRPSRIRLPPLRLHLFITLAFPFPFVFLPFGRPLPQDAQQILHWIPLVGILRLQVLQQHQSLPLVDTTNQLRHVEHLRGVQSETPRYPIQLFTQLASQIDIEVLAVREVLKAINEVGPLVFLSVKFAIRHPLGKRLQQLHHRGLGHGGQCPYLCVPQRAQDGRGDHPL
mmetsp:Transcript_58270/g.96539  ORF Transcript_58270/g.96539 Transcript_58270/m.96539 type:complete len:329 (-) Transcript_58270:131-1117(-)